MKTYISASLLTAISLVLIQSALASDSGSGGAWCQYTKAADGSPFTCMNGGPANLASGSGAWKIDGICGTNPETHKSCGAKATGLAPE